MSSSEPPCTPWHRCLHVAPPEPVRVLCMVLATRSKLEAMQALRSTWGARCDGLVFLADFDDPSLGAVDMRAEHEGTIGVSAQKLFVIARIVRPLAYVVVQTRRQ